VTPPVHEQLRLRPLLPEDAAGVLAIYAPIVTDTVISFEEDVPSIEEMQGRIRSGRERFPWLAAVDANDHMLGYAYACPWRTRPAYDWTCEASVYVAKSAQRQGVARALYEHLFRILQECGFVDVYAGITLPNEASVQFHESCGFTPIARFTRCGYKFGLWSDVGFWQRPLAPRDPLPPRPSISRSSIYLGKSES